VESWPIPGRPSPQPKRARETQRAPIARGGSPIPRGRAPPWRGRRRPRSRMMVLRPPQILAEFPRNTDQFVERMNAKPQWSRGGSPNRTQAAPSDKGGFSDSSPPTLTPPPPPGVTGARFCIRSCRWPARPLLSPARRRNNSRSSGLIGLTSCIARPLPAGQHRMGGGRAHSTVGPGNRPVRQPRSGPPPTPPPRFLPPPPSQLTRARPAMGHGLSCTRGRRGHGASRRRRSCPDRRRLPMFFRRDQSAALSLPTEPGSRLLDSRWPGAGCHCARSEFFICYS